MAVEIPNPALATGNKTGHDTYFAFFGCDNSRAVGAYQPCLRGLQVIFHFYHILHRNPLGNANHQSNTCIGGFHDGIGSKCRRHKDDTHIGARCFNRIGHSIKNRFIQVGAATFARGNAANQFCAVFDHLRGMKSTFGTRKTLYNYFGILVD
jgi:hypothetical protein